MMKLLPIFLVLILVIGCNTKQNQTQSDTQELVFQVNESLLGNSYTDSTLGMKFSPPLGWHQLPEHLMKEVKTRLQALTGPKENLLVVPVQVFLDSTNGSTCVLSRWTIGRGDPIWSKALIESRKFVLDKFDTAGVKETSFRMKDFQVNQFLIMNSQRVIFKLLFYRPPETLFQLDYVIPMLFYSRQVKAVESSIGSLKPYKNQ